MNCSSGNRPKGRVVYRHRNAFFAAGLGQCFGSVRLAANHGASFVAPASMRRGPRDVQEERIVAVSADEIEREVAEHRVGVAAALAAQPAIATHRRVPGVPPGHQHAPRRRADR